MAVVNGDVNVGVNVRGGQGDGARKVDETAASLDKLKGASDRTSVSVLTLKDRAGAIRDAMKESVSPINAFREGLNTLRENLGFVGMAITGVVSVFGALAAALSSDDSLDEYAQGMLDSARATLELTKQVSQLSTAAQSAARDLSALRSSTLRMQAETARSQGSDDLADSLGRQATLAEIGASKDKLDSDKAVVWKTLRQAESHARELGDALERDRKDLAMLEARFEGRVAGVASKDWADAVGMEAKRMAVLTAETVLGRTTKDIERLRLTYEGLVDQAKALDAAADEAIVIKMPELQVVDPRRGGGGGGGGGGASSREGLDALLGLDLSDDVLGDYLKSVRALEESSGGRTGEGGADGDLARGPSRMQALAGDIRDFTASLSESIPMMSEWSSALGQISQLWGDYAESGKGAARATILSVGAIAQAGAEQIKNERLRAGVLSVIHLGLGTALMFVPGAQQEAIGHLAGAAILGSVAIFGGGGGAGSSRGSSSSTRSLNRPLSERQTSGNTTVIINGTYIAGHTMQETAAELHALGRRGVGGGFVPAGG